MSDAWDQIQAIKIKRNSLRERLEKRKKERQDILGTSNVSLGASSINSSPKTAENKAQFNEIFTAIDNGYNTKNLISKWFAKPNIFFISSESAFEIERHLLQILSDSALMLPINSIQLSEKISSRCLKPVSYKTLSYFLQKFATQSYIR